MKFIVLSLLCVFGVMPFKASAQDTVPIGNIPRTSDSGSYLWAIGGHEIIRVKASAGDYNPYMRCEVFDARTVEILTRTQSPPLRTSDIRVINKNGQPLILVRRWLLLDVKPQDARAEGTSPGALAEKWAGSIRRTLPAIAPKPSQFGV